MNLKQFSVYEAYGQTIVILTNTLFNEVDSILVAPVQIIADNKLISGLQIPVLIDDESYYVDLLDVATISKMQIKESSYSNLQFYHAAIKAGLDLLINGF